MANTVSAFGAIVFVDRTGKGLRTAPRDALISLSSDRDGLATAFGVHRALDTAGAMLGPLIAFSLLTVAPGDFDAVFIVSFAAALIGFAILALFVQNRPVTVSADCPSRWQQPPAYWACSASGHSSRSQASSGS